MRNETGQKPRQFHDLFRLWPVTVVCVCFLLTWSWISTSGIDYHGRSVLASFTTAGWFLFGLPFMLLPDLVCAACFAFLARRYPALAWSTLLVGGVLVVSLSVYAALPSRRLARIVGDEVAGLATIDRLLQYDSFNDGTRTYGVISGQVPLWDLLIADGDLEPTMIVPANKFGSLGATEALPETEVEALADDLTCFYWNPESKKIYFQHRSRPLTP